MSENKDNEIGSILETIENSNFKEKNAEDALNKEKEEKRKAKEKEKEKYRQFGENVPKIIEFYKEAQSISQYTNLIDGEIPKIKKGGCLAFLVWFMVLSTMLAPLRTIAGKIADKNANLATVVIFAGLGIEIFILVLINKFIKRGKEKEIALVRVKVLEKYNITEAQYQKLKQRLKEIDTEFCRLFIYEKPNLYSYHEPYEHKYGNSHSNMLEAEAVDTLFKQYGNNFTRWEAEIQRKIDERRPSYDEDGMAAFKAEQATKKQAKMEKDRMHLEKQKAKDIKEMKENMEMHMRRNGENWYK